MFNGIANIKPSIFFIETVDLYSSKQMTRHVSCCTQMDKFFLLGKHFKMTYFGSSGTTLTRSVTCCLKTTSNK